MPRANAILDCSPISAAGHCIPQMYRSVSASQYMDDLQAEEHNVSLHLEAPSVSIYTSKLLNLHKFHHMHVILLCIHLQWYMRDESQHTSWLSLRVVIRQGAVFAMEKLIQPPYFLTLVCLHPYFVTWIWHWTYAVCSLTVDSIGCNIALRAVATVVKMEDDRRLFHNAALRKRRKEVTENMDAQRRTGSSEVHYSLSMPRVSSMILRYFILWAFNRRIVRWD